MVDYAGKRVFVTGATGFIGGRLAERLAFENQADVAVLIRDWRRAVWVSRSAVRIFEGDVTEPESLAKAMAGCQIVFHCVGIGGDPETCLRNNRDGTVNVLRAAQAAGVERVVYLSSVAVHGPNPPDNADESAAFARVGSAYGDSKIAAEEAIPDFTRQYPLQVVTLRPTFVWGPRSRFFTIEPLQQILAGTWRLVDEGQGACHAVYIDNLVDAILLAGLAPGIAGDAYLITDDQPGSWGDFFMAYARMVGVERIPSVPSRPPRPWVPKNVRKGLAETFQKCHDWLGAHKPRLEPFRFLTRAVRYLIQRSQPWLRGRASLFEEWDLLKFGRRGSLNTTKARERLGYVPQITRAEGMRLTEAWLNDQRIIPYTPHKGDGSR